MKKIYESASQAQQRQQELKNLTGEQIILMFKRKTEKLKQSLLALQERHEAFSKSYKDFKKAKQHLESLRDPLLRSARRETLFEKKQVIEKIYNFAGLDLPAEKNRVPTGANSAADDPGSRSNHPSR